MLPAAFVVHSTKKRLRLSIPAKKGDREFYVTIGEKLTKLPGLDRMVINPLTGSILVLGEGAGVEALDDFGRKEGIFEIKAKGLPKEPLSRKITRPLSEISSSVSRISGGELDLPGLVFLSLLGVGVVQILRGNFAAPPWYTAFWYALGVFTKSIADKTTP